MGQARWAFLFNRALSRRTFLFLLLATGALLSNSSRAKGPSGKKVIVFYSSMGKGHLVAAQGIEKAVKEDNPENEVVLKDIRDLSSSTKEFIDRKVYLFIVKHFPNLFDKLFRSHVENGEGFKRFEDWATFYDKQRVAKYLDDERPDVVLATHYGAAETIAALRESGAIRDLPVGWMHTDYFLGYFHRISKAVDRTFLPHEAMKDSWLANDVPIERISTTGLPVNMELYDKIDPVAVRQSEEISPSATVVSISSGGEGVGNYVAMVISLAAKLSHRPLEIYAVCGSNDKNFKALEALKSKLPEGVRLHNFRFIPQEKLFSYIKMSDVYVTKAGGMSPTEGFAFGRPMVIFDNFGGHERINAQFFAERDLALVIKNESDLGSEVHRLLERSDIRQKMKVAQQDFRQAIIMDPVVSFVRSGKTTLSAIPNDFGLARGSEVRGSEEALEKLDTQAPADVEILLSFAAYPHESLFDISQNPFGHIALAIDGVVYTVNSLAVPGQDSGLISEMSLKEYLYGLKPQEVHEYAGSNFGSSYSRDVIGLRINGVSEITKKRIIEKLQAINDQFNKGEATYKNTKYNCANVTSEVLEGVGLGFEMPDNSIVFPLDTFDQVYHTVISDPSKQLSLVNYQQIHDSKAEFYYSRFPLSPYQPMRSIRTLRHRDDLDLFSSYTHRVMHYAGDDRVVFENVAGPNPVTQYRDPKPEDDAKTAQWFYRKALREFQKIQMLELRLFSHGELPSEVIARIEDGTLSEEQSKFFEFQYRELSQSIDSYTAFQLQAKILLARSRLLKMQSDLAMRVPKSSVKPIRALISRAVARSEYFTKFAFEVKDPKAIRDRIFAAKGFFEDVDQVVKQVETLKVWSSSTPKKAKRVFSQMVNRFRIIWEHLAQVPSISRLVMEVLLKRNGSPSNPLPVVRAINRQFIRQANVRGTKISVENRKWLEPSADPKEITLIVPTHREALNDVRIQAKLMGDRPHYIFLAPDNFAPKIVGDHAEKIKGLITVGRGRDKPIDSLLAQLKEGKSTTVMIYPEGSTEAGLGETRPPRLKFANGLIQRLQDEGYKVRLVPVSYDYPVRPYGLGFEESDRLNAFVHKPIEDVTIRSILKRENGDQKLLDLLRMVWLEGLASTKQTLFGMLRPEAADSNFNEIWKERNTSALIERQSLGCESALRMKAGDLPKNVGEIIPFKKAANE